MAAHVKTLYLLVIAVWFTGCASKSAIRQPENSSAQAQIETRLQEVFRAAEQKEFTRLDSYHLYGPQFTKFSGSSPERFDAEMSRKGEHAGLGAIDKLQMEAKSLKIDVLGTTAICTFLLDYSFEASGARVKRAERATLVLVKDRGDWKIVHEHLSPIQV